MITKTIGGDRLGSGQKMQGKLHGFDRDKHDLSYTWRSSMNAGTLVPFMKIPGMPGDTFDIDLNALVKTFPTTQPLYGSFKLQCDVFMCPMRLYQAALHNNPTNIGLKMQEVYLPQAKLNAVTGYKKFRDEDINLYQHSSSCLATYMGMKGVRHIPNVEEQEVSRDFNAIPILAYYDIFKNYYANKMEENAYVITPEVGYLIETIDTDGDEFLVNSNRWIGDLYVPQDTDFNILLKETYEESWKNLITIKYTTRPDFVAPCEYTLGMIMNNPAFEVSITNNRIVIKPVQFEVYISQVEVDKKLTKQGTTLTAFPLTNLDDMRSDILSTNNIGTTFYIDENTYLPYGVNCKINSNINQSNNYYEQNGLVVKTYLSDIFNNFVNKEYVESISEQSAVDVSNGLLIMDALNTAKKVYNALNRIALGDGSYNDWQEVIWGNPAPRMVESPIYCGGLSNDIFFDEVVSTGTESEEKPLGSLAGRGIMNMDQRKGGNITIHVEENCYIIGIVSITPRIDYFQGNDWDVTELKTMDDIHKPSLDGIGFQPLMAETVAWWTIGNRENQDEEFVGEQALAMTPAWMNYKTNFNKVFGNFCVDTKEKSMVLTRNYEYDSENKITDFTSYIDPSKWNYIFAMKSYELQPFRVQIAVHTEPMREVSAEIIPTF